MTCSISPDSLSALSLARLFDNELTAACCAGVAEALQSEGCRLTELDLSVNALGQEGALQLCKALNKPGHPLEKLRYYSPQNTYVLCIICCSLGTPFETRRFMPLYQYQLGFSVAAWSAVS